MAKNKKKPGKQLKPIAPQDLKHVNGGVNIPGIRGNGGGSPSI